MCICFHLRLIKQGILIDERFLISFWNNVCDVDCKTGFHFEFAYNFNAILSFICKLSLVFGMLQMDFLQFNNLRRWHIHVLFSKMHDDYDFLVRFSCFNWWTFNEFIYKQKCILKSDQMTINRCIHKKTNAKIKTKYKKKKNNQKQQQPSVSIMLWLFYFLLFLSFIWSVWKSVLLSRMEGMRLTDSRSYAYPYSIHHSIRMYYV